VVRTLLLSTLALASGYGGTAQTIMPTLAEAHYKALIGSTALTKPAANKQHGFRSGWQAAYLKGVQASPVQGLLLVYVYATTSDARHAFDVSCNSCATTTVVEGVHVKIGAPNAKAKKPAVLVSTCRNIYAAAVLSGPESDKLLAQDAGALVGHVFSRAAARGMTPCR
jgi:hypothetical protein